MSETTGPISLELSRTVPLFTLYQDCSSCHDSSKTCPPGGGAYFPYISILKSLKIFLSETTRPISISFGRSVSLVALYQDCSCRHDTSKNIAARGRGLFSLYICIENFKILLVRNHLTDFNITWHDGFLGDPLPRLFKQSSFVKKTWLLGVGLIFPIYLSRKL